ncbi:MAG TPA: peptide-methionine (S)-S-oxide reductase MsrA, partial [Geminicoccaceae bacterium]|nr:peptide-methionine (S)-S-oxide reductase MsrA [Geminicoccaceae bacterium]
MTRRASRAAALLAGLAVVPAAAQEPSPDSDGTAVAIFASGCFWCTESDFEKVPGVVEAVSGYIGGTDPDLTYEEVSAGGTGHAEAVRLRYDPDVVTYEELLDVYWRNVDFLDAGGQFCDRGDQYRSAIFVRDEAQKQAALESKRELEQSGR